MTDFAQSAEKLEAHLYFGTVFHLLLLRNCVGDHHSFKAGIVDARNSWPREDAVG